MTPGNKVTPHTPSLCSFKLEVRFGEGTWGCQWEYKPGFSKGLLDKLKKTWRTRKECPLKEKSSVALFSALGIPLLRQKIGSAFTQELCFILFVYLSV